MTARVARRLVAVALAAAAGVSAREAAAAAPWVDRRLTLPSGDWAFDFGLGLGHVPGDSGAGVNAEMAVGLTSRVELGVRTGLHFGDGPARAIDADGYGRLFDRQSFDEGADALTNPELRVRGAVVRDEVAEVALEGRVVLPLADGTFAGVLFGVPLAFHLGERVRLDTGAYVPVVFDRNDDHVAIDVPVDVWIQATGRFWLGPMTGFRLDRPGNSRAATDVSLGLGLGYSLGHALDFKGMLLFPAMNQDSRFFGAGAGLQVRIE